MGKISFSTPLLGRVLAAFAMGLLGQSCESNYSFSVLPSGQASSLPTSSLGVVPIPTTNPTGAPTTNPTGAPTTNPTGAPTTNPTGAPTTNPTGAPSTTPSSSPTIAVTATPTISPRPSTTPTTSPSVVVSPSPVASPSASPTPTPSTTGTTTTIKSIQPAVAVRDMACLSCHANITANVITDFGFGDSWYMGALKSATSFGSVHYTATDWQTLEQIIGQVIVPEAALVPSSYVNQQLQSHATPYTTSINLSAYLTNPNMTSFTGSYWFSYFGNPTPSNLSYTYKVKPITGESAVSMAPLVYIGAPTVAEIQAIASPTPLRTIGVQVIGSAGALPGLNLATGINGTQYITNGSNPIQCSGKDVVINGTLLLNNAEIYAEKGGCRLYVTGSVFIEGPITYLNSANTADPTTNLQITSATSIIMGVGLTGNVMNGQGQVYSSAPLAERLSGDDRNNMFLRNATTSTAYTNFVNSIMAEANNIGGALLVDATVAIPNPSLPNAKLPMAPSAARQERTEINFQHILLNAPMIHSRYMGAVNGVVVAETAVFSLGEFVFNYDPVFENVNVLPVLPFDILCTSSTCTPTSP